MQFITLISKIPQSQTYIDIHNDKTVVYLTVKLKQTKRNKTKQNDTSMRQMIHIFTHITVDRCLICM